MGKKWRQCDWERFGRVKLRCRKKAQIHLVDDIYLIDWHEEGRGHDDLPRLLALDTRNQYNAYCWKHAFFYMVKMQRRYHYAVRVEVPG